ncbi:MAG: UspA domain protein [Polaromonas sp.]|jgi:nucleotide-binding universal stress UspA family protein|nr:UspA domain protein [Polaromonas sp.]
MKILLAVDGSPYTQKMLAYITTHGELFSPANEYTLLTVQPPLPPRARAAVGKDVVDSYYADETAKVMAPAAQYMAERKLQASSEWRVGHAGETIANFADQGQFDLLVMGSHGHGLFGNLVMGSVATQVLSHSKVPVLLVR